MSGGNGGAKPSSLALPKENTDAGAMTRLFIAEVEVPDGSDMKEARRAMDWMRCVLMNRLKHPSDFSADKHATELVQIISAQSTAVQFQGFENYPTIGKAQQDNIDRKIKVATDDTNKDQARYINFIKTAIAAATDASPLDPTPTGLFFWMTSGWPKPSRYAVLYESLGGNTFYTWQKPVPKDRHAHKTNTPLTPSRNGPLIYDHKRPVPR